MALARLLSRLRRRPARWSLRSHLLLLVLVALLPLLIFSIVLLDTLARQERAAIERGMKDTARALMSAMDRDFMSSIATLRALASSRSLETGNLANFYEDAQRVSKSQHGWLAVTLASSAGNVLLDTLEPLGAPARPVADRDGFLLVVQTLEAAVGDLVGGRFGDHNIHLRVPVLVDGKVKYVLTAIVSHQALGDVLQDQKIPTAWIGSILDRKRTIAAKTRDPEKLVGTPSPFAPGASDADSPEGWVRGITPGGESAYIAYSRSPLSGWSVALSVPAMIVEQSLRQSMWSMLGGGLILLCAGGLAAAFLARRIVTPIASISAVAEALGTDTRPPQPAASTVAEIDTLARDLERAADMLHARSMERDRAEEQRKTLLMHEQLARTQAEHAEQRFRHLVNDLEAIVWEADARTLRFSFVSRRAEELLGYPLDRWMEPGFWGDLIHPDDRERALRGRRDVTKTGRDYDFEYRVLARDGHIVWLRDIVHVVLGPGGEPEQLRGIMVDVTERRRVEDRLRDEREALEVLHGVGQVLTAELDQQRVIQAVTDAATKLSGAQFGAFFHTMVDERGESYMLYTLSGASREAFADFPMPHSTELLGATFRGKGVIRLDDVGKDPRFDKHSPDHGTPPGHLPIASYLAVPVVSPSGGVLGGLFFGHAQAGVFTERAERIVAGLAAQAAVGIDKARLYEQAARARTDAETANRVKDDFLAVLSHELRTPLNTITLWTEVLRSGQLDPAGATRAIETIERSTRAQARLIEDLLDISRIATGKVRLNLRAVDLETPITAAIDAARSGAGAKSLHLDVALMPGVIVLGDPDRLQQVVANLLSNATKFTPRNGRVEIRLARLASQARIQVSDSGRGLSPRFLPNIFEYFRQADSTTTREHGGLGLGLAIARQLVELHRGSIRAESPGEGQGSTFTVELPLLTLAPAERPQATLAPPAEAALPMLEGVRVLLVEDDRDSREALEVLLARQCGATVTAAGSVREALDAFQRERPDVLISDIGMPQEDGFALIRQVRALAPERGGRVPALALTGYARKQDRTRALAAGYQAHLAKPVDPDELSRVLTKLLSPQASLGQDRAPG